MGFQVSGIASGLDTKSLIDQLMQIEGRTVDSLKQKKSTLTTRNNAFQAINT
ncbi:MAG: flagellar hook-associated 2 domain-containing protein, partial [Cyanobacteria bacterium NC_groundwater_1444_Ag_S-0.65um_54_12]|nr:flagellar hook-associated 2 domain-containing protein [Cyanobacteria bacterium NC_groundwater_1444_Ag_S-0.65um_54_12]